MVFGYDCYPQWREACAAARVGDRQLPESTLRNRRSANSAVSQRNEASFHRLWRQLQRR